MVALEYYILEIVVWSFAVFGFVLFMKEFVIDLLACIIKVEIVDGVGLIKELTQTIKNEL